MHVLVDVTYETILSMPRDCEQASRRERDDLVNQRNMVNPSKPTGATLPVLLEPYN